MDKVIISLKVYNKLIKDERMLRHLEANGVDNWEWYSTPDDDDDDDDIYGED